MDFIRGNENVNNKNIAQLLSLQAVSKQLGIPKSGVQALVDSEQLSLVDVGGKPYITTASLLRLLGQKETVYSGQQNNGYPAPEELSCPLTSWETIKPEKERTSMMTKFKGSVSALKDGRFMVQIEKGKKPDGKRDRENKGFHDEDEARVYLERRLDELNRGQAQTIPIAPAVQPTVAIPQGNYTPLTFEQYAVKMLNDGIGKGTSRTMEGHRRGLSPVSHHIGKKPMTQITQQDLKKTFEKMRYDYVKSSMTRSFNIVKLIMEYAYDNGDIPTNVMHKLKCPSSKKPVDKNPFPTYSNEDIKMLFETSREYSQELYTMFTVLECTGIRPGELRALEWTFFNAEEKTVRIRQAITTEYEEIKTLKKAAKSKEILSVTKSEYGVRTMRLSDLAVQALLDWKKSLNREKSDVRRNSLFIFPGRNGSYKSETSCQSTIQRYRERYDIEDMGVRFYKFRHTMCTRLILAGQPIPVIQRIMGDNTADMVMKIYTHVNAEMALQATAGFYEDLNRQHAEIA